MRSLPKHLFRIRYLAISFAFVVSCTDSGLQSIYGQEQEQSELNQAGKPALRVGTKVSPPFAIKNADGSWAGISIELWEHLAEELDLDFEYEELPLNEILTGLEAEQLDVGVAAISVTSDRLEHIEFCHPHYSTGLGVAVSSQSQSTIWTLLGRIVSSRLIKIVMSMVCIVLVCGFLFWLFERERNTAMFGGKRRQGLGMGFWWSSTLLLGHKGVVPVSTLGRFLALAAMVSSIIVMSILTGVITSVLTVQQLDSGISRATDLYHVRVATILDSTSAEYLKQRQIFFSEFNSAEEALQAVVAGQADAVVYDAALLKYLVGEEFPNQLEVLPVVFNIQEYAIGLQLMSELRKQLNEELLRYRESDAWDQLLFRYLGG